MRKWIEAHPDLWQFILFNILSNVATIVNVVFTWIGSGLLFKSFSNQPFKFLCFDYTEPSTLMLCGFLTFLLANTAAQTVNFFVQKTFVFKSNASFGSAVPKFILLAVICVLIGILLPQYSQSFFAGLGLPTGIIPTLSTVVVVITQVIISFPLMKFWIMPEDKTAKGGK